MGGNDAGFSNVLTTCALPSWASNCDGAINGAQSYIRNTMPGQLASLYAAIRTRAPNAVVVVVGYPRIFNGQDCNALTFFSSSEETKLNAAADLINATTAAQASAAGFRFANPAGAFVGHAWCSSPQWINGLSYPTSESYHPNRAGHASGYTPTVSPQLTGAVVTATNAVLKAAAKLRTHRRGCSGRTPPPTKASHPSGSWLPTSAPPRCGEPPSGTASTSSGG